MAALRMGAKNTPNKANEPLTRIIEINTPSRQAGKRTNPRLTPFRCLNTSSISRKTPHQLPSRMHRNHTPHHVPTLLPRRKKQDNRTIIPANTAFTCLTSKSLLTHLFENGKGTLLGLLQGEPPLPVWLTIVQQIKLHPVLAFRNKQTTGNR